MKTVAARSFFLQAEDGIRDGTVTGVQTCALPICRAIDDSVSAVRRSALPGEPAVNDRLPRLDGGLCLPGGDLWLAGARMTHLTVRSEERRVGKESRTRRPAAA